MFVLFLLLESKGVAFLYNAGFGVWLWLSFYGFSPLSLSCSFALWLLGLFEGALVFDGSCLSWLAVDRLLPLILDSSLAYVQGAGWLLLRSVIFPMYCCSPLFSWGLVTEIFELLLC